MRSAHPGQQDAVGSGAGLDEPSAAEQAIAADIERTRAALGDTVEQLAQRARVGTRVRLAAADVADRAKRAVSDQVRAAPAAAQRYRAQLGAATVVLALAVVALRKLRR